MKRIELYAAACALSVFACGGITERRVQEHDGASGGGGKETNPQPASGGAAGAAGAAVSASGTANADGSANPVSSSASCFNDTDCAGMQCGGEICDWAIPAANPVTPDKPFTCRAAGQAPKGHDGWCTTTANCKCGALGATCLAPYCTFTRPTDAPP